MMPPPLAADDESPLALRKDVARFTCNDAEIGLEPCLHPRKPHAFFAPNLAPCLAPCLAPSRDCRQRIPIDETNFMEITSTNC